MLKILSNKPAQEFESIVPVLVWTKINQYQVLQFSSVRNLHVASSVFLWRERLSHFYKSASQVQCHSFWSMSNESILNITYNEGSSYAHTRFVMSFLLNHYLHQIQQ